MCPTHYAWQHVLKQHPLNTAGSCGSDDTATGDAGCQSHWLHGECQLDSGRGLPSAPASHPRPDSVRDRHGHCHQWCQQQDRPLGGPKLGISRSRSILPQHHCCLPAGEMQGSCKCLTSVSKAAGNAEARNRPRHPCAMCMSCLLTADRRMCCELNTGAVSSAVAASAQPQPEPGRTCRR